MGMSLIWDATWDYVDVQGLADLAQPLTCCGTERAGPTPCLSILGDLAHRALDQCLEKLSHVVAGQPMAYLTC